MKKSTFRIIKSIFLLGFLFLFGLFVFLLTKQETAAGNETNLAGDDETNGRVMLGGLKQIGFEYNSTENTACNVV